MRLDRVDTRIPRSGYFYWNRIRGTDVPRNGKRRGVYVKPVQAYNDT